jgi:protein-L-isoaspartate(D-aspartate) O-methyltransferase
VHVGDGTLGLPGLAPFGGIAVAAATSEMPPALWTQLEDGRRIVLPLGRRRGQRLSVLERVGEEARLVGSLPARFVPLVEGP